MKDGEEKEKKVQPIFLSQDFQNNDPLVTKQTLGKDCEEKEEEKEQVGGKENEGEKGQNGDNLKPETPSKTTGRK